MEDDVGGAATLFHAAINPEGTADVVMYVKRTGTVLATWARDEVNAEVVSAMVATLVGCVETAIEALDGERPSSIALEAGGRRAHVARVDRHSVVVLFAPGSARFAALREEAERLVSALSESSIDRVRDRSVASTRA